MSRTFVAHPLCDSGFAYLGVNAAELSIAGVTGTGAATHPWATSSSVFFQHVFARSVRAL